MTSDLIFSKLWENYTEQNPIIQRVYSSFTDLGENVINDHIAFRTINDPRINIGVLEKPFTQLGYKKRGNYFFEEKKLKATHYELPGLSEQPKVFISELLLEEFSPNFQKIINKRLNSISNNNYMSDNLILSGNIWGLPSYEDYNVLREESEYAAWFYVNGFRANHFTVSINHLVKLNTIDKVNQHLKNNGFKLNTSGGEIKGTKSDLLQQSSIMAEHIDVEFKEGMYKIPGCYYEFAIRYADADGDLFNGFLAKSANKIFESTDFNK